MYTNRSLPIGHRRPRAAFSCRLNYRAAALMGVQTPAGFKEINHSVAVWNNIPHNPHHWLRKSPVAVWPHGKASVNALPCSFERAHIRAKQLDLQKRTPARTDVWDYRAIVFLSEFIGGHDINQDIFHRTSCVDVWMSPCVDLCAVISEWCIYGI